MSRAGTGWMLLCGFRVHGPPQRRGVVSEHALAGDFAARLWHQATEGDRIQHIRVRVHDPPGSDPGECCLDIGILLMADDRDKARAVGARLCSEVLAAHPDTVGWTLLPLF